MGCGSLYRLWNSHLTRKGIIRFITWILISQAEFFCLPLAGYLRRMDSKVTELSWIERGIAMESGFYYYGAYVTAGAEISTMPEEEKNRMENDMEEDEESEESENPEEHKITITPEIEENISEEQIPREEYLAQMLRENGIADFGENFPGETEEDKNERSERPVPEYSWGSSSAFELASLPAYTYDWSKQWTEDDLRSEFFAVDGSTSMKTEYLNAEQLLNEDLTVANAHLTDGTQENREDDLDRRAEAETTGPQILIYHTHASEAFADSVEGDPSTTIVGAGDRLAELLEGYGFRVLHDTGVYDEDRDHAYEKALPAIEQILEENPTIEVVIDLHRDEMANDRKLVMDLQGRPTARFMFFNGLSYLRKQGEISYLENPYIMDNLAFSFQAQVLANEYYPGIARKIYLKAYRYNMHLRPKSMLIELGAQNNTVEEIRNACDPLAHVLAMVLKKR